MTNFKRLLSRVLKVHVNVAKDMLFEFHKIQNAKKPGTIHATYLISGILLKEVTSKEPDEINEADNEDNFLQSSPLSYSQSSTLHESTSKISVETVTLVKEVDLEKMQSKYEIIDSIHIYSLGLYPIMDLQTLSDATRELKQLCFGEDPLKSCSIYGTIRNKDVKLRGGNKSVSIDQSSTINKIPSNSKHTKNENPLLSTLKIETQAVQLSVNSASINRDETEKIDNTTTKKSVGNSSVLIQPDKCTIHCMFPKSEPRVKQESLKNHTADKNAASNSDDIAMKDMPSSSDDEVYAPVVACKKRNIRNHKSRKQREEELKKMMEDEEEKEKNSFLKSNSDNSEEEMEKGVESEVNEQNISNGKRRCRRRIMKKTTFKDEEGYLVTKEEPVWESFSEEEPVQKPKVKAQPSITSKPKKAAVGTSGQGSIMSFFGKK